MISSTTRRSIRKENIRIEALVVPPLSNNVYIVFEDGADDCIVVDVAQGAKDILSRTKELELRIKAIINTHGHSDHIAEDKLLRDASGAKLAIHEMDAYRLATEDDAATELGIEMQPIEPDIQLVSGQEVDLGKASRLRVLHTPGHTEGSICLWSKEVQILFSGDTLFASGYGRVDGAGADSGAMKNSLRELIELPSTASVYPGHGEFTTIGNEESWIKQIISEE
jgi:hydroxyacylglutathione hydrolase